MKAVGAHSQSLAPLTALVMAILTKYHCQLLWRWPAVGSGDRQRAQTGYKCGGAPVSNPSRELKNGGGCGGRVGCRYGRSGLGVPEGGACRFCRQCAAVSTQQGAMRLPAQKLSPQYSAAM